MMSKTEVLILAAGRGTRLGMLGSQLPKALIQIDKSGATLISRLIEQFKSLGQINVVAGHRADLVVPYLHNNYPKVNVIVNDQYAKYSNSLSMKLGLMELDEDTTHLIVIDADTYLSGESATSIKSLSTKSDRGIIFTTSSKRPDGEWEITTDDSQIVTNISDNPTSEQDITSGVNLFTGRSLAHLIDEIMNRDIDNLKYWDDIYYNDYSKMQMLSYSIPGFVYEVDNPEDIEVILGRSDDNGN